MAILPSIMSLFGGQDVSQQPQPQPQAPQPSAAGTTATPEQNPTIPSNNTPKSDGSVLAIPAAATGTASPLENFNDLWKPVEGQKPPQESSIVPILNLDNKSIMELANKVDFTSHISPDLVTKALSGDSASFMEVLNSVARLSYANATVTSGKIVEGSLANAQGALKDNILPNAFRQQNIQAAVTGANPIFTDPSVAPMLGMLQDRLSQRYTTASPEEIAGMATQILSGMAGKIVTAQGGTVLSKEAVQANSRSNFQQKETQDWEKFFN